jgi:hypothetical protein
MPIPSSMADLSTVAASNSPAGSESPISTDDFHRAIQAILRHTNAKGLDIASAATIDLGAATGEFVDITGTTTITSLGTVAAGIVRRVRFTGILTLTHNATSLILPGSTNIPTANGDCAQFVSLGAGNWLCVNYIRASAQPLVAVSAIADNSVTTAKIANAAVTNAKLAFDGGTLATRNKFINGAMAVDQRNNGAAQTITAGAALAYTVDRWYGYSTGGNVSGQRVSGTAPNQFNYRYTGAASVTKIAHAQRIEASNSQDLAGNTATLAVDLANSLLTTVTWVAYYANTSDTFGSIAVPTKTQIATGTFTVTSTLARFSVNITIPSAAITGIEIEFSVGAQTSGTWTIGRAQLEAGSTATAFETRSVGQELALCQRYYEIITNLQGAGNATSGGQGFPTVYRFAVPKRATPTITLGIFSTANSTISAAASQTDSFVLNALSGAAGIMAWSNTSNTIASAEL